MNFIKISCHYSSGLTGQESCADRLIPAVFNEINCIVFPCIHQQAAKVSLPKRYKIQSLIVLYVLFYCSCSKGNFCCLLMLLSATNTGHILRFVFPIHSPVCSKKITDV
jgi:hypothetical protein